MRQENQPFSFVYVAASDLTNYASCIHTHHCVLSISDDLELKPSPMNNKHSNSMGIGLLGESLASHWISGGERQG